MNRKSFLKVTAGLTGAAVLPLNLVGCSPNAMAKLSIQLYTVRDEIEKDLEGTIQKIADIGFKFVETAFWPKDVSLEQASSAIERAGLKVSSCHVELPTDKHKNPFSEIAQAFDCKRMI